MLNRPTFETGPCPCLRRSLAATALALVIAAGCSSTAMSVDAGGSVGGAGGGIGTGTGGAGGHGNQDACAALQAAYSQALVAARSCDPSLNSTQCAQTAEQGLPCPGCVIHVNDKMVLDQLRAQYQAASCPPVACPAIACIPLPTSACVPSDGGTTGTCN